MEPAIQFIDTLSRLLVAFGGLLAGGAACRAGWRAWRRRAGQSKEPAAASEASAADDE